MTRQVTLTDDQLDITIVALETWTEGYEEATTEVITDPIHDSPEQLLEAVSGMHDDYARCVSALEVLRAVQREEVR